jgi:hypothetical protein
MDIFAYDQETREQVVDKLTYFLKGDENALRLLIDVLFVGHLWDDLVDRDKPRSNEEISKAFTLALGEIPLNPYYPAVYHLLRNAMGQWETANELAHGTEDDKLISFLIRNALMEVATYLMFLVGGQEWLRAEGANFWRYFGKGMAAKYQEFLGEVENA